MRRCASPSRICLYGVVGLIVCGVCGSMGWCVFGIGSPKDPYSPHTHVYPCVKPRTSRARRCAPGWPRSPAPARGPPPSAAAAAPPPRPTPAMPWRGGELDEKTPQGPINNAHSRQHPHTYVHAQSSCTCASSCSCSPLELASSSARLSVLFSDCSVTVRSCASLVFGGYWGFGGEGVWVERNVS